MDDLRNGSVVHAADLGGGSAVTEEDQRLIAHGDARQRVGIVEQVAAQSQAGLHVGAAVAEIFSAQIGTVAGGEAVDHFLHLAGAISHVHPALDGDGIGAEHGHRDQTLVAGQGIAGILIQEFADGRLQLLQIGLRPNIGADRLSIQMVVPALAAVAAAVSGAKSASSAVGVSAVVGAQHPSLARVACVILTLTAVGAIVGGFHHGVGHVQHQRHRAVGGTGQLHGGVSGLHRQGNVVDVFHIGGRRLLGQVDLPVGLTADGAVLLIPGIFVVLQHRDAVRAVCRQSGDVDGADQQHQAQKQSQSLSSKNLCHYFVLLSNLGSEISAAAPA